MKATLKFDMDSPDDAMNFRRVNKSEDMCHVLWELATMSEGEPDALCEGCKKKLYQYLNDNNIAFEEIWA